MATQTDSIPTEKSFPPLPVVIGNSKEIPKLPYFMRRIAIVALFRVWYNCDRNPGNWRRIARQISEWLHIPAGSIGSVVTLIKYVVSLGGNWNQFDVHEGEARRHKGQFAIEIDSPEAAVLVSTLEAGLNKTGALGWAPKRAPARGRRVAMASVSVMTCIKQNSSRL